MLSKQDWQGIETVMLDMDGTLLDLHFDNVFWNDHMPRHYARVHKLSLEQAREYLLPIMRELYGSLEFYCLDHWQQRTGFDLGPLKAELRHLIQVRPHVIEFLQRLRRLGKQVHLVTNAHHKSVAVKMAVTALDRHLDEIFTSHDFGAAKEHAEFWPRLQRHSGFAIERSLFVDDNEDVLDAARAHGIRHVLGIHQPDSQRQREPLSSHPAIHHFDEIMPDA